MKTTEYQNKQTQLDEGPCDVALPSEIKKMTADVFSKYALWKKECEEEEARNNARNESDEKDADEDVWTKNFKGNSEKRLRQKKYRDDQQADEFEEGMISGDWEALGITNDDLEPDDAFGGGSWSVGLGGPNSKFYWFKEQNTGTHFATVVDIGNGTWKIEDADGNVVTDAALKSWDEVEKIVGRMFLGPRTAHDETPVEEGHRTLPAMDTERYTERKGLEGPIRARNGKVVYYDPKEGQYYDPDTDIYISNDEWEGMNESSPMPGADYGDTDPDHNTTGDTVEHPTLNGATVELDTYEPGEGWWAVGVNENGEESDEIWIPEAEVKPIKREGEDDNVSGALDTMRQHFHDYNQDPSNRWEKYNQYRNQRKQISKRAKDLK